MAEAGSGRPCRVRKWVSSCHAARAVRVPGEQRTRHTPQTVSDNDPLAAAAGLDGEQVRAHLAWGRRVDVLIAIVHVNSIDPCAASVTFAVTLVVHDRTH